MSGECDKCGESPFDCLCNKPQEELYIDRHGHHIRRSEWQELLCNDEYKRIASNSVGSYIISTIWTGLDRSLKKKNDRLSQVFETMIFKQGHVLERHTYYTEASAIQGHNELVGKYFILEGGL